MMDGMNDHLYFLMYEEQRTGGREFREAGREVFWGQWGWVIRTRKHKRDSARQEWGQGCLEERPALWNQLPAPCALWPPPGRGGWAPLHPA